MAFVQDKYNMVVNHVKLLETRFDIFFNCDLEFSLKTHDFLYKIFFENYLCNPDYVYYGSTRYICLFHYYYTNQHEYALSYLNAVYTNDKIMFFMSRISKNVNYGKYFESLFENDYNFKTLLQYLDSPTHIYFLESNYHKYNNNNDYREHLLKLYEKYNGVLKINNKIYNDILHVEYSQQIKTVLYESTKLYKINKKRNNAHKLDKYNLSDIHNFYDCSIKIENEIY